MPTKVVIDCSTGIETVSELTDEEVAANTAAAAAAKEAEDAAAVVAAQAATDKASGNAKLKTLGLTDAEIAALVG